MEVHKREIQTYETLEGKIPFEDWLDALRDREGKAKIKVDFSELLLVI